MKIRILDRILVALAGLLMLAGCAAAAAQLFFGKNVIGAMTHVVENENLRIWLIVALVLFAVLGCYCVLVLFRHRGRKGKFIMQRTENGELSISLKAMESMVVKCLDTHKELNTQSIHLENQKGGLLIRIKGTVAGGVSIPLTVDALQQQIKQYVTACSGVEVKDIRVMIESSGPDAKGALFAVEAPTAKALPASQPAENEKAEKAEGEEKTPEAITPEEVEKVLAEAPAPKPSEPREEEASSVVVSAAAAAAAEMLKSEAPAEDDDRPMHQRLFSRSEEPCVMPMPPEAETAGQENAEADKAEEKKPEETKPEETKPEENKAEETSPGAEPEKETGKPDGGETEDKEEGSK